jgi:hypothetical protein
MGIPRKGSRRTEVDGKPYRFLVKETHIPDHHDQKELVVVVQEEAEKPGNVLRFRYPYGAPVTPETIAVAVRQGLGLGWNPSARGSAFELPEG